jgi:hypothetical protein
MADGEPSMVDEPGDEPAAEAPKYDQTFFLKLAREGKRDGWNEWRRDPANSDKRVTFAGIDFSEAPWDEIDFSGFKFGDQANFSGCKWRGVEWEEIKQDPKGFAPGRACFAGAAFGSFARFDGAVFGSNAYFVVAAFDFGADLRGAAFGDNADFSAAVFGFTSNFSGAAFGDNADFSAAAFGFCSNLSGAVFGNGAAFTGAAFGDMFTFDGTMFKGSIYFEGKSEKQFPKGLPKNFKLDAEAFEASKQRLAESWQHEGTGPERFKRISFANARFDGEAVFSGPSFEQTAHFTNARFYYPPIFDTVTNPGGIDFTGAHIGFVRPGHLHWTKDTEVPLRLRAFRKIAEDTKNHDLERDLYIEERKAERGVYWRQ